MSSAAQAFWGSLPPEEQARRVAYYDRTARRAYDHCCSILIGCPHEPATQTRSATGVLIKVEAQHYLLTAAHVVEGFADRLEQRPAHFQVGQLE
jgi:S1-C subfamily serine protease